MRRFALLNPVRLEQKRGPPCGGPHDPMAVGTRSPRQKGYAKVKKSNRSSSAGVFNGT
jgi:hypothetical protein